MTAIKELHRMLDERGVEYRVSATGYSIDIGPYTTAYANRSDTTLDVSLRHVTPEQAIAATLGDADATGERQGVETCHNSAPTYLDFLCSECGFVHYHSDENDSGDGNEWHFCPDCGRRVVADDDRERVKLSDLYGILKEDA